MAIYDDEWFEIWHTGDEVPPVYILVVISDRKESGSIRIVDPIKNNEIVFQATNYEEVCDWLTEDEYSIANGREFPDDGW